MADAGGARGDELLALAETCLVEGRLAAGTVVSSS